MGLKETLAQKITDWRPRTQKLVSRIVAMSFCEPRS